MNNYFDNYIEGKNLTEHQLQCMHYNPLDLFAYKIKDKTDYQSIKGGLAIVQMSYGKCIWKDVFYILDKTGLTKWQKFKLKFQFLLL